MKKVRYKSITVHVHPAYHKIYKYLPEEDKKALKQALKDLLITTLEEKKPSVKFPLYTCPVCLMRFKQDDLYHKHLETHDEFVCFVCGKKFPYTYDGKVELTLHFRKMHSREINSK